VLSTLSKITNVIGAEPMRKSKSFILNMPRKMPYPKVAGADNPMAVLGESEAQEVSAENLMKLYQEYKAK